MQSDAHTWAPGIDSIHLIKYACFRISFFSTCEINFISNAMPMQDHVLES